MLSILIYVLLLVFTLVYFVIFGIVFLLTVAFDRRRKALHMLSQGWVRMYFGLIPGWRVEMTGMENIEKGKSYVVVVNHRSMLDIMLMFMLPMEFKWVSKREVYKWPIFGWVLWMRDDIAIERGTAKAVRQLVKDGDRWLSQGVSVTIFPEGTRNKGAGLARFREGALLMAKNAGVGVLPCVSLGTGTAIKGWRLNFRNRFKLHILQPVSAEQVQAADLKELTLQVREMMAAEYDKMELQGKK